jgi:hypothetical protein
MTKPTYKVIEEENYSYLERTDPDGKVWSIPMDEGNSDYQRYLNPEAEDFTPSLENGTIS